jgi:GntR family transcriptional regulator
VRDVLRHEIESGRLQVGDRLPPEIELCATFDVSRSTIRTAIRELSDAGMIHAKPGVGTVIIRPRPDVRQSMLSGLTEELRDQGVTTSADVLLSTFEKPTASVKERLRLENGERVLHLRRLRTVANAPLALLDSYVPESIGISPSEDLSGPLYELIERTHHRRITHGQDVVGARTASQREADILEIASGAPVLTLTRTAYIEPERPVEYVEATIRSDLYTYRVTLSR